MLHESELDETKGRIKHVRAAEKQILETKQNYLDMRRTIESLVC